MATDEAPFADLPAGLVEEMLGQTSEIGKLLLQTFQRVKSERENLRKALVDKSLIMSESDLGYPPLPTTCAADGSYAIERLLTVDLAAAAAVAVEGLTPPSEKRHWDQPHHSTFVAAEVHHAETATVLRSLMLGRELLLATAAPHELVMIDGTLTLPIIYFNQAIKQAREASGLKCSQEFAQHRNDYLQAYLSILQSRRSDKNYAGLPKYSTRREIGRALGWPGEHDDRGLLTLLLRPGELTVPTSIEGPNQPWHLGGVEKDLATEIVGALENVHVFYYKPHTWLPALRVEVAQDIANNKHRLATVVQGLKQQCSTAAMMEPYPLYLADRTVKALARAVPAFRQVTTQHISENFDGDIGEVFFAMHGYRSETGA